MKAIHKEFLMEIRKSKARFLSILFIVALGVAFFSGIQASSPDMRLSGDAYFDSARLMDLKIVGTMGLTEEDIEAVKKIDGVESVEGAYFTDVLCGKDELKDVLHVESVNETLNYLEIDQGKIPEKSGEIFLDSAYAQSKGYEIGDKIVLEEDGENSFLKKSEFIVAGIGSSPLYISFSRGNTTLGSGEVAGFAYILPEDFDQSVYTQIYLRAYDSEALVSYTEAYDKLIEKIQKKLDGIKVDQCQIRYESIIKEANRELSDGEKELTEAKAEAEEKLSEAKQQLDDGEQKLSDGKTEYKDGKKQILEARQEISDGKKQLQEAKQELSDGEKQLQEAKEELVNGEKELANAREQLVTGWSEIGTQQQELDAGWEQLIAGKEQLAAGQEELILAETELNEKQQEITEGIKQAQAGLNLVKQKKAELLDQKGQCEAGLLQVEAGFLELEAGKKGLEELKGALAVLQNNLAETQIQIELLETDYSNMEDPESEEGINLKEQLDYYYQQEDNFQIQIEQLESHISETEATLTEQETQLEASRTELEKNLDLIVKGMQELATQEIQLSNTISMLNGAQEELNEGKRQLEAEKTNLEQISLELYNSELQLIYGQEQLEAAKNQLVSGQNELAENEQRLSSAAEEIASNEETISSGRKEIAESEKELFDGEKELWLNIRKLFQAKKELVTAEEELLKGKEEYETARKDTEKELADARKELDVAKEEIENIEEPKWMITDRNALVEYSDYGDNAERIRNLGSVFPVIFFLVAALISLTTMTRMVEDQRTQIGTMKALGYGKTAIAGKYLGYAFLATAGGSALGIMVGEKLIPFVVIKAYGIMYVNMGKNLIIDYELKYAAIASGAAILCTMGATIASCYKVLAETPAALMRPPAPKEGKRVLLERIPFIWRKLSFTWKSTIRNLFRYKKRFFMTIFGIAGSMALLLVGFGLHDSIMDIGVRQYEALHHYQGMVILDETAKEADKERILNTMEQDKRILRSSLVHMNSLIVPNGKTDIGVYLYVPSDMDAFEKDVTLQNRRTEEPYSLTDQGVVISEKTASMLKAKVSDEITIKKDNREYPVTIAAITENYLSHYVYMTPELYRKTFGEEVVYGTVIFTMQEEYASEIESAGNEILNDKNALSISYTSSIKEQLENMLKSLNMVIVVLIVSAGMLAFVVLYNLNNINIAERQRELATLKVLGFYDGEVSQYVFRENLILTFLGILAGIVFGIYLHQYVVTTVEVDAVMFGRNIKNMSFFISAILTMSFSLLVNMAMHFKLKKINMVESLKSVE